MFTSAVDCQLRLCYFDHHCRINSSFELSATLCGPIRKLSSILQKKLENSYSNKMSLNIFRKNTSQQIEKPYKQRKSFASRREEVIGIRLRFPDKIPVIVERYSKERNLPRLDKTKFLVPQDLQMAKFVAVIRSRMHISSQQAFYLIIKNQTLASMTKTMAEIYKENKDEDGFLFITYASQEMFGEQSEN